MSNRFVDPILQSYYKMAYHVNRKDKKDKYPRLVRRTKTEPKIIKLVDGSFQAIPSKYIAV